MVKLKPLLLVLSLIGIAAKVSVADDEVKLDVGDKVDISFDKQTSQTISSSIGMHPDAFGAIEVIGTIGRYEDGAFIAIGEFGINGKDKKNLVRITVPVQLSQCKPVPQRYRNALASSVVRNPTTRIESIKGIKVERWELATKAALNESTK